MAEFGNAWKTGITCDDDVASTGMAVDACVLATHYKEYASGACAVLKSGNDCFLIIFQCNKSTFYSKLCWQHF